MPVAGGVIWILLLAVFVVMFWRRRQRGGWRGHIGPGASGAVYDMLNADKRNAIEIIVEQRAEERDPEDKDGNLPDLAGGRRRS